jgi:multidrug efflux pump subunit AcrA (membrane-fusion protein)
MSFRPRLAAALAILAFAAAGCSKPPPPKPPAPPSVKTAIAANGEIAPKEQLPGLIAPFQNVAIESTLTEPTIAVNVQEGDHVRRGEVLAVLDTTDLRAQMASDLAQAHSDSAGATHTADQGELTIQQSQQSVQNAKSALAQAQQTLSKDSLDLARYQELFKNGFVAQQQVATQLALVRNDRAAVVSAQASLASAGEQVTANGTLSNPNGLQASSVSQAAALAQVALAQADQIRASIDKAVIVSPIDGVVVNRNLNVGEYPGTRQIFTLQQVDPVYAILQASGTQVANINVGQTATVASTDLREKAMPGRIAGILNEVNPGSTDFEVKVLLANPGQKLRPGMAIEGTVALAPVRGIRIPYTAFLDDNHTSIMTVGSDSTVKTTAVTEIANDGTNSIVSGLAAGTRVVSDGQTSVGDGQKVAVR